MSQMCDLCMMNFNASNSWGSTLKYSKKSTIPHHYIQCYITYHKLTIYSLSFHNMDNKEFFNIVITISLYVFIFFSVYEILATAL